MAMDVKAQLQMDGLREIRMTTNVHGWLFDFFLSSSRGEKLVKYQEDSFIS